MSNLDSGTIRLKLDGKTFGHLTCEITLTTRILPAVQIVDVMRQSPTLANSAFTLASLLGGDVMELFHHKQRHDTYTTNYLEGDSVTRVQITLPDTARSGAIISDIGGIKGLTIKCPPLTKSPIINVLAPTFSLQGIPEVRAAIENGCSHGRMVRIRVSVPDVHTAGHTVEWWLAEGVVGNSIPLKIVFTCPILSKHSRYVMVLVPHQDPYVDKKDVVDDFAMLDGLEMLDDDDEGEVRWDDSPMSPKVKMQ